MGCHDHRDCLHDLQTALYTVGILVIFLVNFLLYSVWQTKLDSRQFLTARKIYRISYHIVSYWYFIRLKCSCIISYAGLLFVLQWPNVIII